ncbi:DEAD/DEAH box helicase [Butyrivibrio fibrisolvens]|uniref:DEAD/DEAH box helicase n=1 Tax=Butyrivibrio fibrisolvens TaxID=831 RepID=UPI00040EFB4F|nr:DEAD/DEAH box helicase [Butyrivibrio fibrisolvens]
MSNSNYYKPDFKVLVKYIRDISAVDGRMLSIQEEEARARQAIEKAAADLRIKFATKNLSSIPVSELSGAKAGIRVAALEKAGYHDLSQLAGRSEASLSMINGIGEAQAKAIRQTIDLFTKRMAETTSVRIDADSKDPENWNLVFELYKYMRKAPVYKDVADINSRYHQHIAKALSDIKIRNSLRWVFSSAKAKESTVSGYETLIVIDNDNYQVRSNNLINQYETFRLISLQDAKREFLSNSAPFYALLDSLNVSSAPISSVYKDIPSSLAEEIERQELDTSLLNATLRQYQIFGAKYALHQENVLLGDEMGLGKTIMAIASMASVAAKVSNAHFLVVCPASVLINWCREIEKHSALKAHLLHASKGKIDVDVWQQNGGVAVTNYESLDELYDNMDRDLRIEMLVVDEAHYIKNPKAQRTKYLMKIRDKAKRTLLMTGTPLENKVDEMCNLIGMLRQDDLIKDVQKYAFMNQSDEFKKVIAPVYLRRVREDVLKELPEMEDKPQWCEMSPSDKDAYVEVVREGNFMTMRRVGYLQDDISHSSKAVRLLELCDMAKDEGRKIIVFSFYLDTISKVCDLLKDRDVFRISGSTSIADRQAIVDEFTNSKAGSILVSQVLAGGTGLNIQTASVVIFCEPQIKPSLETQAISRVYRMGQVRNVLVYHLLCSDTIDEDMVKLLENKQNIFDEYANESEMADATKSLADKEWISSVVERQRKLYLASTPQ